MTEAKNGSSTLPINQILCGECVETMKTLPSEYIDLTQFSPPYWGLRDYGVQGQIGLEDHPTKYVEKMVQICQEIRRLLKKTGSMYIVIGDTYFGGNLCVGQPEDWDSLSTLNKDQKYNSELFNDFIKNRNKLRSNWLQPKQLMGIPWRVAIALQEDGWILRNDIIWNKPNHMPSSVTDRLTNAFEHIFHFVKSRRYYYNLDAIREAHKEGVVRWGGSVMKIPAKHKTNQGLAEALISEERPWRNPNGKNPGDVLKLDTVACPSGPQRWEREGTNRVEARFHPDGKNPGDVFNLTEKCGLPIIGPKKRSNLPSQHQHRGPDHEPNANPAGANPSDFWSITTKPFKGAHFAVYPEEVCVRPILSSCPPDGVVLDPMCGSGTTLAVAKKLGRKYVGIELNPAYIEIANKRLSEIPEKITSFL